MDSVDDHTIAPNKNKGSRMGRTFSKVFSIRSLSGISSDNLIHKVLNQKTQMDFQQDEEDIEKLRNRGVSAPTEAFLAKLFASISAFKAAYSQLQFAQFPYDPDGIQSADELVISELKCLSELKYFFLKKKRLVESDFEGSYDTSILLAEIKEQNCLIKTYQVLEKKFDSDLKVKDSELTFFREKLEDVDKENKVLEKRLNSSGQLSMSDHNSILRLSSLSPRHFVANLRQATKAIRSFVRLLISEMESAEWDLDAAAESIESGVDYGKSSHKCYTFESFVCRQMFDGFDYPEFVFSSEDLPEKDRKEVFFDRFMELKSLKAMDYLAWKPKSSFSRFCQAKYLSLIHPKMESSFFGNLDQRNLVNTGEFPETTFFVTFAEMAKRVWLLHCLGFSLTQEVSAFQVKGGSRFSEVFMECVNEEGLISSNTEPRVAFTVVPGFRLNKTAIQCQVYMC